ncbi:MAG: hypothetical protein RSD67_02470 [Oscillospiraceae bacterium]
MGTPFEQVYDRALTCIKDYKLDNLAKTDYAAFLLYWQSILELSVPFFTGCLTSLDYNTTALEFNTILNNKEISILASIMVEKWFGKELNDVTQFKLHLNNKEFKTYSENANIKERSEYIDRLREKYKKDITDYQLSNLSKIPFFSL